MSISSRCVNKPMDCPLLTSLPVLFDLRLRFRLRLCLHLNVKQTLAQNCYLVYPFFHLCFSSQVRNFFDFLNTRTRLLLWQNRSPCSNNWDLWRLVGFVVSLSHLQQLLNPILVSSHVSRKSLGRGRGDMSTFSFLTSAVSILTTFGIQ